MNQPDHERREASSSGRRKRIITKARKEQNRISQQLYRQRQKDRIQSRESSRHAPMKQHQLRPLKLKPQSILLAAGESAINAAEDATTESSQTPASGDPVFNEPELQTDSSPSISLDLDWMTPELFPRDDFNGDEDLSLSMASASLDGMLFTPSYSSTFFQDPCMAVTSNNAGSVNGLSAPRFFDLPTSNLSSWPTSIDATTLSCYTSPKRLSNVTQYPPPDSGSPVSESTTTLVPDPQSAASTPYLQDLITATSAFLYGHPIPITPSTPPVPSPYLNYIQTTFTSTLHAYFHNLPCINLSPRDLLVHRSPFYNPCVTAGSDPEAILTTARHPSIPPDLQPTLAQVLIPHPPYLDLLPFPAFREKAIVLGGMGGGGIVDPWELKRDVFMDGVVYRRESGGVPWEGASWEARGWFVRKWRVLVG